MNTHIEYERKFLIGKSDWMHYVSKTVYIVQGYLSFDIPSVRIRKQCSVNQCDNLFCNQCTFGDKFTIQLSYNITIKGTKNKEDLACRDEFNIPVSPTIGDHILRQVKKDFIVKQRHFVKYDDIIWTIDEFKRDNQDLIVAEVENSNNLPKDEFNKSVNTHMPTWVLEEVTQDPDYLNVNLARHPYNTWDLNKNK